MSPIPYEVAKQTLWVLLPEFLIIASATAMMTAGAFVRLSSRTWAAIAAGTLGLSLLLLLGLKSSALEPYMAVALNDPLAMGGRLVFLLTGLIVLALAHDQVDDARASEFFGALLMIDAGSMLVSTANELVFLFVGLEMVSIPTYLLLYLSRRNASTQEAATKYFFLSIFSSGLLLFGLAYLYGMTGVSNLKALAFLFHGSSSSMERTFGLIAVVFAMAGLSFRVAAVPFHFYAPDVYQGSPTVIAALLAWVPKGVGFVAILRALTSVVSADATTLLSTKAVVLTWVIAAATMTLGNTVALAQENLRRLFAYSSIAHAGYLMIGVAVAFQDDAGGRVAYLGAQGVLFYLVAYALMTLGAFGVFIALSTPERPIETVEDLAGLAKSHPMISLALTLCLFSLAGVPPLAGFMGKLTIFGSALFSAQGANSRTFQLLALVGAINAAIGAYYYLRIVVVMWLRPPFETIQPRAPWPTSLAVWSCAILSLVLGIFSQPILRASRDAAVAAIDRPDPSEKAVAAIVPNERR